MPSRKIELTDISNSVTDLPDTMRRDRNGCHVSILAGFICVLLAAAVAVGVGIIVHFAGGNREVVCQCDPGVSLAGQLLSECWKLASSGATDLCGKCPVSVFTSTVSVPSTSPVMTTTIKPTPITVAPKITDVRLPSAVYPEHYNVEIQTYMVGSNPANFTFKGSVKIWLRCDVATENVTLHINQLHVDPSSIRFVGDFSGFTGPTYKNWTEDKNRQFLILNLNGKTEVGGLGCDPESSGAGANVQYMSVTVV
ncbi:hypothetical protein Btru_047574 [Bulinus truncatus]|nr:hypothetical protein Btru_047574 [Bulinus truncatus]